MKIKIYLIVSAIFFIFFLNIFNSNIASYLYSKKLSTVIEGRKYPVQFCNDIIDFKIKNLKTILIGDSHSYSGVNLEKVNIGHKGLFLPCALPKIRFEDNIKLMYYFDERYNPELIIVGLSAFQFLTAGNAEELNRVKSFKELLDVNPYSFRFTTIKRFIKHQFIPVSEFKIAKKQQSFFEDKNETFFNEYIYTVEDSINITINKKYNKFKIIDKKISQEIKSLCKNKNKIKSRIVFIDIPTPEYFNKNLLQFTAYQTYVNKIQNCFPVIRLKNNNIYEKRYFFDRTATFRFTDNKRKNIKFKYDISHLNYAGALKYTNFLMKELNNIKNN